MSNMSKQELMRQIQMISFAVNDVVLFLDTHPDDKTALDYYKKYSALLHELMARYTTTYGPLLSIHADVKDSWTWIDSPWPWDNGNERGM